MRQGLYTSGILHSFAGLLLITNFQLLENKPDESLSNVSVKLLSEQDLMKLSERETTKALEVKNFEPEKQVGVNIYPKKPDIPPKKNVGNEIIGESEPEVIKVDREIHKQYGLYDEVRPADRDDFYSMNIEQRLSQTIQEKRRRIIRCR